MSDLPRKASNAVGEAVNGFFSALARGAAQAGADYLRQRVRRAGEVIDKVEKGVRMASQLCGRCHHPRYEHVNGRCACGCPEFVDVTVTPPTCRDDWRPPR